MDSQDPTISVQETIDLMLEVLPGVDAAERPYYEQRLDQLYQNLCDEQYGVSESESSAMAGAFQFGYGNYTVPAYPVPSYTASSYDMQVPTPPHVEPAQKRKQSLGPADYPEAKRVS